MSNLVDNTQNVDNLKHLKVKIGNLEVFDSKTVQVNDEYPLTILIEDLSLKFSFSTDPDVNGYRTNIHRVGDKDVELRLVNFNSSGPVGTVKPTRFGAAFEREWYITFSVSTVDVKDGLRVINYVILLGDNV